MGVCRCGRAKGVLLVAALLFSTFSTGSDNRVRAQELESVLRWDGRIELISGRYPYPPPSSLPPEPADGPSQMTRHAVSADGRYIVFTANAPSLGYSEPALYIRDRRMSETRVLLAGRALEPAISGDGNHVAFTICDQWIRPDNAPICDVWALDLRSWTWTLISGTPDGIHGTDHSDQAAISSNGRFVVFKTTATNLLDPAALGQTPSVVAQLVIRDRDSDGNGVLDEPGTVLIETVSLGVDGPLGNGDSETPEVSDDGRYVAFRSMAGNLDGVGPPPGSWNVFRRDRQNQVTRRINVRPEGAASPFSIDPAALSMSGDGRIIAFASRDPLLAPSTFDDTNNALDVFVFDQAEPFLKRIDIGQGWPVAEGYVPGTGDTQWPSLSADGRYVALQSAAANVTDPPAPGSAQVYVVDRQTGVPTRIGVKADGTQPDADTVMPVISGDGSLVAFISLALNLSANVQTAHDRIYAAVHFKIDPAEMTVPGAGGGAVYTVTTQQHTQWWVDWNDWQYWVMFDSPPEAVGSGELRLRVDERNYEPSARSATIRIFDQQVTLTQSPGLSLTALSPTSGPEAGGTRVTLTGTGFEPSMIVMFDGYPASEIELVDSTTARVTTPAHAPGTVWVGISTEDGQGFGWLDQGFHYSDGTPPEIWSWVDGTSNEGWFSSDATVMWAAWDPESEILTTSGCDYTVVNTDTPGTTFTCTATSEGGTATKSVVVNRDTTAPSIAILTPTPTIYELNSVVQPVYACTDPLSGVAQCGDMPPNLPLDTSGTGWKTHYGLALDRAGNSGYSSVDYAVSTGVCTPVTTGLRLWFQFEGDLRDTIHGSQWGSQIPSELPMTYVPGMVGSAFGLPGWQYFRFSHQLADVSFTGAMTFAAWVKADGHDGEAGVLASQENLFRIARFPDGTVRWAFANADTGFAWVNTGATIPQGMWTHVAITYDHGVVKTYLNGRLLHTHEGTGDLQPIAGLPYWAPWLSLGNRLDPAHKSMLTGAIDEVQMLDAVWEQPAVEASFFAGAQGMCKLTRTVVLAGLSTATYGNSSFLARAQVRVGSTQQPIPGKPVRFVSHVSSDESVVGSAMGITDGNGWAEAVVPMSPTASVNTYFSGIRAYFDADQEHAGSMGISEVAVQGAYATITWPTPAPITYGTPLGSAQRTATANIPGIFWYTPSGTPVLPAGSHTLSVRFDPNSNNYQDTFASVTLEVMKAMPALTWAPPAAIVHGTPLGATQLNATSNVAGTWSYSPAAGTVLGGGAGQTLRATFTPTDAANYETRTITTSIDVLKATATVNVTGGTDTYDAQAHPASGSVTGVGGAPLSPLEFQYNGSPTVPVDAGTYTVVATYAGDANHSGASGTATITINKAQPSIVVTAGTSTYDGTARSASGSVTGVNDVDLGEPTYTYNGSPAAPVNAGTYSVLGTYAGSTNYSAGSASATLTINKAVAALTWSNPAPIVYGIALGSAQLNASADVPGTFSYTPAAGSALAAGTTQALTATFVPADATNYEGGTVSATIDVARATPTVSAVGGTFPYDATTHPATGSVTGVNSEPLSPLTFTYNGAAAVPLNAGSYAVAASYAGSGNYEPASATATITIAKATPALSVTGGTFTYDGAMHPATGSVTGVNSEPLSPLTFTYNGAAAVPLNAGSYAVVASYAGNMNYEAASAPTTIAIGKAAAGLTWTRPAAIVYGTPLTAAQLNATANVAGSFAYSPAPGTVFHAGIGRPLAATFTPADPANYAGGSIATTIDVLPAPLAILANNASKSFGAPLPAFTAAASGFVNGDSISSLSGTLVLSTNAVQSSPVGMYPIVPSGIGSPDYAITFLNGALAIVRGAVTVTVVTSPEPSGLDQPMSFTATVSAAAPAAGQPTGTVQFFDGATLIGTGTLSAGTASISTAGLDTGGRTIETRYGGDPSFEPGTQSSPHVINGAASTPAISASSSRNPSNVGQSVTLTANISMPSGAVTGVVAFYDGATLLGSSSIATGRATLTLSSLPAGSHAITARYAGTGGIPPSRSGVFVQAVGASSWKNRATTITVTPSANPSSLGAGVTVVANVTGSSSVMPTGRMLFMVNGEVVADLPVSPVSGSTARATVVVNGLNHGRHKVTATYLGDSNYKGISGAVMQRVN